jgi:hypothetical protein
MSNQEEIEETANTPHHDERATLIAEIESRKAALAKPRLLPGIALLGVCVIVLGLFNAFAAINGQFPGPTLNYGVLIISGMVIAGAFGMLALRRWGWALVLGAVLLIAILQLLKGVQAHEYPRFIISVLFFVFFLYLIRPEVRERMR